MHILTHDMSNVTETKKIHLGCVIQNLQNDSAKLPNTVKLKIFAKYWFNVKYLTWKINMHRCKYTIWCHWKSDVPVYLDCGTSFMMRWVSVAAGDKTIGEVKMKCIMNMFWLAWLLNCMSLDPESTITGQFFQYANMLMEYHLYEWLLLVCQQVPCTSFLSTH